MELFDQYNKLRADIFDYFDYVEDWRVLPLDDARQYFWRLEGEGPGCVIFAEIEEDLGAPAGNYYKNEIYTQRHLPKWVYRGAEFTMVVVDTHTDGNQLLQVFDNAKLRPAA